MSKHFANNSFICSVLLIMWPAPELLAHWEVRAELSDWLKLTGMVQ